MYGSGSSNEQMNTLLAERIFKWLLDRGDFIEWLDRQLMDQGLELFAQLDSLTAMDVGRVLLGMPEWIKTRYRTVGGGGSDVPTFFTERVKEEVAKDSFLESCVGKSVPVTAACLSMVGEAVKRTRFYTENATEMRRRIRHTKVVRHVMDS